ncbi:6-phosphofructo-2-kinase [Candida albicans P75063]|nr:6-phosphofructo-2-kinase [Candida albicans P75063]
MPPTSTDSTNNSTPSPNTSANSSDQFPHHSQESIRNLIAANFKQPNPRPQQQPHPQQHSSEPSHPTSNLHQVSSNSTHSSDISPTDSGISLRPNRVKSYSISNGVLSHSRTANKRVSFSNLHSTNSSQLSLTSSESSENEIYSDEDEEEDYEAGKDNDNSEDIKHPNHNETSELLLREPNFKQGKKDDTITTTTQEESSSHNSSGSINRSTIGKKIAKFTAGSMTPSPNELSPTSSSASLKSKKNKSSYPYPYPSRHNFLNHYGGEKLALSKSLDSQLLEPYDSNSSVNSFLPEFNKRPLTDTPIVSTIGSPITREQSYDDYDEDEDEEEDRGNINSIQEEEGGDSSGTTNNKHKPTSLHKTKNISHLNLSELSHKDTTTNKDGSPDAELLKNSREHAASIAAKQLVGNKPPEKEDDLPTGTIAAQLLRKSAGISDNSGQLSYSVPSRSPPHVLIDESTGVSTPVGSVVTVSSGEDGKEKGKELVMAKNVKDNLLKDLPPYMKEQFEKTPSLEKLKNLLMHKPPPSARKAYTLNIPGQTSSKTSPDGKIASVDVGSKLVIVMVGLPARGKSYITNKLTRYLNWLQHDCRVFNVGNTRRKDKLNAGPENQPLPDKATTPTESRSPRQHDADFFNPENKDSTALREKWAMDTLDQLLDYVISGSGSVGIFDATNSTKLRRKRVLKRIQQRSNGELPVLYLESVCNDPSIIESNIRLKLSGPDYKDMDPKLAFNDFVGRLHNYEKAYETIDEEEEKIPGFQYVKMIDVGKKVVSFNIKGFLASQTIYFLLNFNLCERQIWITRHGESQDNLNGRIGGDANLTKRGLKFAQALTQFMNFQRQEFRKQQLERFSSRLELKYNSLFNEDDVALLDSIPSEPNFCVWTSMLTRAVETGQYFNDQLYSIKQLRMLNELGGGKFEGMTYEEIQSKYPKEFASRLKNKLSYRYPGVGGESYLDVLTRLRPLIAEVERTTDHLLIISHRVVSRILLAYFLNLDKSAIGELDVPLHTLYCLESHPYGTDYTMYEYDENLDWFVKAEPEHQKNVKEVGVVFKERKYSVVPTAPPTSKSRAVSFAVTNNYNNNNNNNTDHTNNKASEDVRDEIRRRLSMGTSNKPTLSVRDGDDKSITAKHLRDLKNLRKPMGQRKTAADQLC